MSWDGENEPPARSAVRCQPLHAFQRAPRHAPAQCDQQVPCCAAPRSRHAHARPRNLCALHTCRLHYPKPTFHGEKLEDALLYKGLSAIGAWRDANRGVRPQMVSVGRVESALHLRLRMASLAQFFVA